MEGVGGEHHDLVVEQIREACKFFSCQKPWCANALITQMLKLCGVFFEPHIEEKMKYRNQMSLKGLALGAQGYGSKIATKKTTISDWVDQLHHKSLYL